MAIFRPKICSVCGREYRGLGFQCKDGHFCGDCYDKLLLLIPQDHMFYNTVSKLKKTLEDNEDVLKGQYKKEMPQTCPICGKKLGKLTSMELPDGYICTDCAEKAVDMIPGAGYESVSRIMLSEIRTILSGPEATGTAKGEQGRRYDPDDLRIACPLIRRLKYDADSGANDTFYEDPLAELGPDGIDQVMEKASRIRNERRALYGEYKTVFSVDLIEKPYTTSKTGVHYTGEYLIYGRVLLGRVEKGAVLSVYGRSEERSVRAAGAEGRPSGKDASEGFEAVISVKDDVPFVYPGDVLVCR